MLVDLKLSTVNFAILEPVNPFLLSRNRLEKIGFEYGGCLFEKYRDCNFIRLINRHDK